MLVQIKFKIPKLNETIHQWSSMAFSERNINELIILFYPSPDHPEMSIMYVN